MPRDLTDLLAEGAPRDPGHPDLDAIESRAARRRTGRIGAGVLGVIVAAAIGIGGWPSTPELPMIDEVEDGVEQEDGTTVLPLPDPGSVLPAHANGRPVFVVHGDDGEVRVLDAISPHDSDPAAMKVLAYCESSGWFVDPWHGSKFSDNGAWVGGPAPHGLATHEVLETGTDTLVVGGLRSAPARGTLEGREPDGPDCGDTAAEGGVRLADLLVHIDVTDARVAGLIYPERPDDDCCGLLLRDQPQVAAGPAVTIDLPEPGEVAAVHVDGRPAFLVVDGEDTSRVTVLDAVSPHDSWAWGERVLAWCAPSATNSGVLVDLWHGSMFTVDGFAFSDLPDEGSRAPLGSGGVLTGGWGGGPAPTGTGRYAVLEVDPPTEIRDGFAGGSVTVGSTPLPPPPRVGDEAVLEETCSERVALFPDSPPADPLIREDLVVHEPGFADDWWYPTPERLFGERPGLPPDELERYLDTVAADRVDLTLDDLPALGEAGFAAQTALGVELLDLGGVSLGTIRGTELAGGDPRDGHGGAFLLLDANGAEHWVAPSNGSTMPGDGTVPSGYARGEDGTWTSGDGFLPPLDGPLHVGNEGRHTTAPRCDGTGCPAPTVVDFDMGGVFTSEPGCVATDGFGDLNHLEVCTTFDDEPDSSVVGRFVDGERRWPVPRYEGQPADIPTIGHYRDAVFGPGGVVAQLSLECEVPVVVVLRDDGSVADPWGAEPWERGPTSILLGTTTALGQGAAVPLVQVAANECGSTQGVEEGVWALEAGGPRLLNDMTQPVVLWTHFVADLDEVSRDVEQRSAVADACEAAASTEITDVDLDGDGQLDRVVLDQDVVACMGDGRRDIHEAPPIEFARVADLGTGADVLAVGGTLVSSSVAELLLWMNERLTPVVIGCTDSCIEPEERVGDMFEDGLLGGGQGSATWGCRTTGNGTQLLTVRAEHGVAQVTVTTVTYELSSATLDEVDRTITTSGDIATEFVALDHLRELGATRYCER